MVRKPPSPCMYCGGPKPPGQGRKACEPCLDKRRPLWQQEETARRNERARQFRRKRGAPVRRLSSDYPEGKAWCARCQQYLDRAEFASSSSRSSGTTAYCRPCRSAYHHEYAIRKAFGLSGEDYDRLLQQQEGRCAICTTKPRARRLAVDHDHKTGVVRGLLCTRCNHKILGAAKESPFILRRAATYLDSPPAVTGLPIATLGPME